MLWYPRRVHGGQGLVLFHLSLPFGQQSRQDRCEKTCCLQTFEHEESGNSSHVFCRPSAVNFSAITLTVEILDVEDQIQVAGDEFSCIVCGRAFPKLWLCRRHVRTVHTEDQEVSCNICNRTLKNQGSLKTHLRGCHNIYQRM